MTWCLHEWFAVIVIWITLKKHLVEMTGTFFCNFKPLVFSRRTVVSNSALVHMPHVIKLMTVHYP